MPDINVADRIQRLKNELFKAVDSFNYNVIQSHRLSFDSNEEFASIKEALQQPENGDLYSDYLKDETVLACISSILTYLHGFDEFVDNGEMLEATRIFKELEERLATLIIAASKHKNICPTGIIQVIKQQKLERQAMLHCKLQDMFSMLFVFTDKGDGETFTVINKITNSMFGKYISSTKYLVNPIYLDTILESLDLFDLLEKRMKTLSNHLLTKFIIPILSGNNKQELVFSKTQIQASVRLKRDYCSSVLGRDNGKNDKVINPFDCLKNLNKFGIFLKETIFLSEASTGTSKALDYFSSSWYDSLIRELTVKCLYPAIPSDYNLLQNFVDEASEKLGTLQNEWKEYKLIPQDKMDFSNTLANIPTFFTRKRRTTLLSACRDILISEDSNTVQVQDSTERGGLSLFLGSNKAGEGKGGKSGKEGLEGDDEEMRQMKFPQCHISIQAQMIVDLVYQTIEEIRTVDQSSIPELLFLTRDIFDLYRSIFPTHHAESLSNSPARAMVFYNDTQYVCHHLLTLGEFVRRNGKYNDEAFGVFGSGLDMVQEFRRVGENCFRFMMRKQRDEISAMLGKCNGFHQLSEDDRFDLVEKTMRIVIYHITGLGRTWKVILPKDTYLKVMGTLTDSFISNIFDIIKDLSSTKVEREDAYQLRYILGLIDGVSKAFDGAPLPKFSKKWDSYLTFMKFLDDGLVEDVGNSNKKGRSGNVQEERKFNLLELFEKITQ